MNEIIKISEIVYFNSFGSEHVPEESKEFIRNKDIIANIFWVQANNSVMCGYFCIGFIDFMLVGKKLTIVLVSFLPMSLKRMMSYFKDEWNYQNKPVRTDKILWNNRNWKLFSSRD